MRARAAGRPVSEVLNQGDMFGGEASPLAKRLVLRPFPPQNPGGEKALSFPVVHDPEAPPIRPERHVENSIATLRKRLTIALARSLYRCPCCHSFMQKPPHYRRL